MTLIAICSLTHARADAVESVDFNRQVRPILAHHCYKCHARGKAQGGLRLDSRESLLAGSDMGAVIKVGKSAESKLIERVSSTDPDIRMPLKGAELRPKQIAVLRAWIDQGLPWDDRAIDKPKYPLALRTVELPPGEGNPIDRVLADYFQQHDWSPPSPVPDSRFARRVYLDVLGLLPTPQEVEAFLKDTEPQKRQRLVKRLLAEHRTYVEHWMTFWCDHLRVGSDVDGGVFDNDLSQAPHKLLQATLEEDVTHDVFVRQLITGGYLDAYGASIAPEGEVGSPVRRPEMQHATIMTQVFLGVQLKCASCHDSFVDHWKLHDAWAMASAFGDESFELFRCQQPTGETAAPRFLFPELGSINESDAKASRRQTVADLMTSPRNGLFARTIVNRLWARFFGRGLIDPLDEMMEHDPWYPELLEWLSVELVRRDYNLKDLIHLMLTSRAYALPGSIDRPRDGQAYVFRGPEIRRLTAEQFLDAIHLLATPPGTAEQPARPQQRAWQQENDRLMSLLGRPSRDSVVTAREQDSFPLQSLELINGTVINRLLDDVTQQLLENYPNVGTREMVEMIYRQLLTRDPTPSETETAESLLGEQPDRQSVSDLVWTILMLPEFQLIH